MRESRWFRPNELSVAWLGLAGSAGLVGGLGLAVDALVYEAATRSARLTAASAPLVAWAVWAQWRGLHTLRPAIRVYFAARPTFFGAVWLVRTFVPSLLLVGIALVPLVTEPFALLTVAR